MTLPPLGDAPLVSVIIANYNYGRYLPMAVQSVVAQSYSTWELVICDDGSTDDSVNVLEQVRGGDPRITVLYQENQGQAAALNHAFQYARGEIIALLDPDDWFTEQKLDAIVRAFTEHPRAGLIHHYYQPTDGAGEPIGSPRPHDLPSGWLYEDAIRNGGICFTVKTSELAIRAEVARRIFPLPAPLRFGGGDTYIGMLATFLTEVASIPDVLTCYRQHEMNAAGSIEILDESRFEFGVDSVLTLYPDFQQSISSLIGLEGAAGVSLRDMHWLWEHLALLYVLKGKPPEGVHGYAPGEILARLQRAPRRIAWSFLFSLPAPLSRRALVVLARGRRSVRRLRGRSAMMTRNTNGRDDPSVGLTPQVVQPNSERV